MKRFCLIILSCLLLSGCMFDPVFDMSNWQNYQSSLASIKAKLSNDDIRRLDIALKYLAIETTLKAEADTLMASNLQTIGSRLNPLMMFNLLRPRINGKSAASIIADLTLKLDTEIAQGDARLKNVGGLANSVEVTAPYYAWKRVGRIEQPTIEFAVFNGSKAPISRIYFRIALTTPNRSIPWAKQDYIEAFTGGLEPREKRQLTLSPSGNWSDPQLRYLSNAELKVDVVNFEDANGQKMIGIDPNSLELERKVRAALQ
jgi:hypothetical protein